MKKGFLLLMLALLLFTSVYYLYQTEKKLQYFLNQKIPALQVPFQKMKAVYHKIGLDFRWTFLILFILFLLVEFAPSHTFKKSPGLPRILAFVFGLAFILTLSLILFIYNLPYDQVILGNVVIDRGPKDVFLSTLLHYTIMIGNAHFFGLLLVAFWMEISKEEKNETE